jgi:hypothetical protein
MNVRSNPRAPEQLLFVSGVGPLVKGRDFVAAQRERLLAHRFGGVIFCGGIVKVYGKLVRYTGKFAKVRG